MAGAVEKFFFASMVMWMAPLAILYGFNHDMIPGKLLLLKFTGLSSSQQTIWSGFVAVISVNMVIGVYIYMAMKESTGREHLPDPNFLAAAEASIAQSAASKGDDSTRLHNKEE